MTTFADASQGQQAGFVQLTQDQIRDVRQHAEADLFYFARAILGYRYLTESFHRPVADFVSSTDLRKLVVLARGHFKTTLGTISYPLWRALRNREIRILIVNATATNAEKFLASIKWHVDNNPLVRALWPEVLPDKSKVRWSTEVAELRRDSAWTEGTFEAIGVGGAVASRHYDLILKDDLVDLSEQGDMDDVAEKVARAINWHQYSRSLFVNAENGEDVIIGTRWGRDDFIKWVEDHETADQLGDSPRAYRKYQRSAIEGGAPTFPRSHDAKHGFTLQGLEELRTTLGPYKFSGQYLLDPCDPSVAEFKSEWLRYWERAEDGRIALPGVTSGRDPNAAMSFWPSQLNRYLTIDPALSRKRKADYTGIVCVGCAPDPYKIVLEAKTIKAEPDQLAETVIAMNARWRPIAIGIEVVAAQKLFKPYFELVARTRGIYLPIREFRTDTSTSKENRIRGLVPEFAFGNIYLPRGCVELVNEYSGFPTAKDQHLLDALAYAPQLWSPADAPEADALEAEEDERVLAGRSAVTGY